MKIKWWGLIAIGVLMGTSPLAAEPGGGTAGAYLKLGMNAAALGMGSAYTAAVNDASAAYWNPAGLADVQRQEFCATYTIFPDRSDYTQIAYALPLDAFGFPKDESSGSEGTGKSGTLSLILLRFAAAYDIEARHIDSVNPDYFFSDGEGSYGLAYGLPLNEAFSVGIGCKGLFHQIDQTGAKGWGCDAGVRWHGWPQLKVGLSARDLYSRLDWSTGWKEYFPPTFKLGAAYDFFPARAHALLLAVDGEKSLSQRAVRFRAGIEYGFNQAVFLRLGYDDGQPTGGGSFRIPGIGWGRAALKLDYALVQDRITGWDQWITLKLEF